MRSDILWGSKPHLQVAAYRFTSWNVGSRVLSIAIELFHLLIFTLSITMIQLCKVNSHFPLDSRHSLPSLCMFEGPLIVFDFYTLLGLGICTHSVSLCIIACIDNFTELHGFR